MIDGAAECGDVRFLVGSAERLPLASGSCDLVAACSAFHWFDGPAFLDECRRTGRSGSHLVLYSNALLGGTEGSPEFSSWFGKEFRERYPRVRAGNTVADAEGMARWGFQRLGVRRVSVEVGLTVEQVAGYLSTRSNVIAATGEDPPRLVAAAEELRSELERLSGTGSFEVAFGGDVIFYQAARRSAL